MSAKNTYGFTLIELVVTLVIVAILGSAAFPVIKLNVQRAKETELRADLRQIRDAIDAYKKAADEGRIKKSIEETGYPPNLEILVTGVPDEKDANKHILKFLRKIPVDPMLIKASDNLVHDESVWGLRSYDSEASNPVSGEDVYDIYSRSNQTGINGIPYAQW
ncbi:MAG: type II secretion system protein [Methylophilaceae bacterium]